MRSLLLSFGALALVASCGSTNPFVKSEDPCAGPVLIPERWLNDREVERLWAQDRNELIKCGLKVETLSGRSVNEKGPR